MFLVCYFINNIIFNKLIPMDRFSFFNSASSAFFDDLYEQYLNDPDSVEPSWRSFSKVTIFKNIIILMAYLFRKKYQRISSN